MYILNIAQLTNPVEAESSWEVGFVHRAALLAGVTTIQHQPFRLTLKAGKYTPDFAVGMSGEDPKIVVEIKRASQVIKYREVFDQAAQFLGGEGLTFFVLTEAHLQGGHYLKSRAMEVLRYRKHVVATDASERVQQLLSDHGAGMPLGTLAREAGVSNEDIYALASRHAVQMDAGLSLHESSVVSGPSTAGDDHANRFGCWFGASPWPTSA